MQSQSTYINGYGIGIDLGGTKIEIILSKDHPLNIIHRKRQPCNKAHGYQGLLQQIQSLVNECMAIANGTVTIIGMGIPGSINAQTQLVRNCNITTVNGQALKEDLSALLNHAIWIENDANCFTLSESLLGVAKGYKNVLGLTIGTGVGSGLVMKEKIYIGKTTGYAPELGHTSIDYDGFRCWCGNRGCVENYISGTAIERIYQQHQQETKNNQTKNNVIKAPEIYQRYLQKEPAAIQTFEDYLRYFGTALANFIYMFDPDIIVLGGGGSAIPLLYDEGKKAILSHFQQEKFDCHLVKNQLGDSSGIFGALLMAQQKYLSRS